MKIGVVGTFIRDRILPWQRPELRSIGGLFFTVSYLANLVDNEVEVYPVCNLGDDLYDEVAATLLDYGNVRLDGMTRLERENTQVCLHYTAPQERDEITTEPMPPLDSSQLSILEDADAVIVNLISGVDVDLAALRKFRERSPALLYLDFHSRALAINADGKRYYNRPDDWRDWVDLADVLQLNEMEARTLAGVGADAPIDTLHDFGKEILLTMRPSVCHITLGEEGSYTFFLHKGRFQAEHFAAAQPGRVVDIIGCGDAFEAAYMARILRGASVADATIFAHKVAAANCTFLGSSGISEVRQRITAPARNQEETHG